MADPKTGTGQTIERLYAWVGTAADGGEGIVAHPFAMTGIDLFCPLVGADRVRIESYRSLARNLARKSGRPVRLIEFSTRTVLEDAP